MSFEAVKKYFEDAGLGERVMELEESSATVELAAKALSCEPGNIAKTMSFIVDEKPILILTAGDERIDNKKYKAEFQKKAKMIPPDEVLKAIGHAPGGVCPFAVNEGVSVWLDVSLKRFDTVYPAAGSAKSAVKLSVPELFEYSNALGWVDVCSGGA